MTEADEIRKLRQKFLAGRTDFARLLGVHPSTLASWENGIAEPSLRMMALIDVFRAAVSRSPHVGKKAISAMRADTGVGEWPRMTGLYVILHSIYGNIVK